MVFVKVKGRWSFPSTPKSSMFDLQSEAFLRPIAQFRRATGSFRSPAGSKLVSFLNDGGH